MIPSDGREPHFRGPRSRLLAVLAVSTGCLGLLSLYFWATVAGLKAELKTLTNDHALRVATESRTLGALAECQVALSGASQEIEDLKAQVEEATAVELDPFLEVYALAVPAVLKKDYEAAREPLEKSLKLVRGASDRSIVYHFLKDVYRETKKLDGLMEVFEYEVTRANTLEKRQSVASDFIQEFDKAQLLQSATRRYEQRLTNEPDSFPAIAFVWAVNEQLPDSPERTRIKQRFDSANVAEGRRQSLICEMRGTVAETDRKARYSFAEAARIWGDIQDEQRMDDAARKALKGLEDESDEFLVERVREDVGDGYLSLGKIDEASAQFEAGIKVFGEGPSADLLRMKIDDARKKAKESSPK